MLAVAVDGFRPSMGFVHGKGRWTYDAERQREGCTTGSTRSQSGMLPCFFGGLASRFSESMSKALAKRGLVSLGSITSST